MLNGRKLVVDSMCEVFKVLRPHIDEEFWDFSSVELCPDFIYIFGRQRFLDNISRIRELASTGDYTLIFDNSAEGSWTAETQLSRFEIEDLVRNGDILMITGAEISKEYAHFSYDYFLPIILDYQENVLCQERTPEIFSKVNKPYKFLFLNGRARPHRKYLYERLKRTGALEQSLWTMLDSVPCVWKNYTLRENGVNVMATSTPLQRLPDRYEVSQYRDPKFESNVPGRTFLKHDLFKQEWGEIYLEPAPYIDTYFSLVTETVCGESDYSFRTEKIAKPLAIGHPFIVAANRGFYRDLKNLGFRTFDHVIDESFDLIDNAQERVDRIVQLVTDLSRQDLSQFLEACQDNCKYNQQHLAEFSRQHKQQFPQRFSSFLLNHG